MASRKPDRKFAIVLYAATSIVLASVGFSLSVLAAVIALFTNNIYNTPPTDARSLSSISSSTTARKRSSRRRTERRSRLAQLSIPLVPHVQEDELLSPVDLPLSTPVIGHLEPSALLLTSMSPPSEDAAPQVSMSPTPLRDSAEIPDVGILKHLPEEASLSPETRGRRRKGLSKLVHLFGKRSSSSEPAARAKSPDHNRRRSHCASVLSAATTRSPPTYPSPVVSLFSLDSHAQMKRSKSALGLRSPSSCPSGLNGSEKQKELRARPRTQPYAAPYFVPPPDSADVIEPLSRDDLKRRRTMSPPDRRRSLLGPTDANRCSVML